MSFSHTLIGGEICGQKHLLSVLLTILISRKGAVYNTTKYI